jgi:cell division protein FtsZ
VKRREFVNAIAAGMFLNCLGFGAAIAAPCVKRKIVGIVGAGCNIIQSFALKPLLACADGFVFANTDVCPFAYHRKAFDAGAIGATAQFVQLGESGLGTGGSISMGRSAALLSAHHLIRSLEGANQVVIVAGLGRGTGSGAAPVVARLAKEIGATSVALVVMPFSFEGAGRCAGATRALEDLRNQADHVVAYANDGPAETLGEDATMEDVFGLTDARMLAALSHYMTTMVGESRRK